MDQLRDALSDPHVGAAFLTGVERVGELPLDRQLDLARLLDADLAKRVYLCSTEPREGLCARELTPEMSRILRQVPVLAVPPLAERIKDLPELTRAFARSAGIDGNKHVRLAKGVDEGVRSAVETGLLKGEAAELRTIIERAVDATDGDRIGLADLGLKLPAECQIKEWRNGRPTSRTASSAELLGLGADDGLLILMAEEADRHWRIARVRLSGEERELEDDRLGRILYRLASEPGVPIELTPLKSQLGLLPHERLKHYIHRLRQALDDTDVNGRRSRYIESHYGECYSFLTEQPYCLVTPLATASGRNT